MTASVQGQAPVGLAFLCLLLLVSLRFNLNFVLAKNKSRISLLILFIGSFLWFVNLLFWKHGKITFRLIKNSQSSCQFDVSARTIAWRVPYTNCFVISGNDFSFQQRKLASDVGNITAVLICSKGVGSHCEKVSVLWPPFLVYGQNQEDVFKE